MNSTIEEILIKAKDSVKDLELDNEILAMKKDISKASETALDKAANYIIKAMPVPDAIKDILKDVKDAIKTKDFKNIVSTAVSSSVREGLEILGLSNESIKNIYKLKDVAMKGGLAQALKNGIEIIANNYLKNNIVGKYVYDFFHKLKNFVLTNSFSQKINEFLKKLEQKKEKFFQKCNDWYNAYSNMDIEKINTIAKNINGKKEMLSQYVECAKENQVIQNMTKMINSKHQKLTDNQLQLCKAL